MKTELSLKQHENFMKACDVTDLLGQEFPQINPELEKMPNTANVYKTVQCFADLTKRNVSAGNMAEVKHCFAVAEKLLREGNSTVKSAIENVYLYSMAPVFDMAGALGNQVKSLLGSALKKEYHRQVHAHGI